MITTKEKFRRLLDLINASGIEEEDKDEAYKLIDEIEVDLDLLDKDKSYLINLLNVEKTRYDKMLDLNNACIDTLKSCQDFHIADNKRLSNTLALLKDKFKFIFSGENNVIWVMSKEYNLHIYTWRVDNEEDYNLLEGVLSSYE